MEAIGQMKVENAPGELRLRDSATGLPTTDLFMDRVGQAILAQGRGSVPLSVAVLDMETDEGGAGQGRPCDADAIARQFAGRLVHLARRSDSVCRLGPRTFACLLLGTATAEGTAAFAEKLISALRAPLLVEGVRVPAGVTIGVAIHPQHGGDGPALLRNAQRALGTARHSRRGFEIGLHDSADAQTERAPVVSASHIRDALSRNELHVQFQPKVDLRTRAVVGVEALARWQSPGFGLMLPGQFIPAAERLSVISPVTFAILDMALDQARQWASRGLELPVSVNLSSRMFEDERLVERIAAALDSRAMDPKLLTLEITEAALCGEPARVREQLHRFMRAGIGVSIDDFGTGRASLQSLRDLEIAEIKIDRLFVSRLERSGRDASIVQSIVSLAKGLDARVVAEGIEERSAWSVLQALGCQYGQGYDIARPMTAPVLEEWMEGWKRMASAALSTSPEMHYA
ncbi:MAG: bifunctional diguanylate cyclase/phosphodiesterase [Betaproteobacteria bacterium]|nr:bifunctional diguanylate cyclase/phosphodiesterase [Betaproteobacteria bacterium]